ncbi:MAG TPA: metallophosphoesterase family protein [Bryobacteraceae bacterium]|jgi:hypothetical protein
MAKIAGIISDTHGLIRSEALQALAGVDLIIHAGDIGGDEVLEALRAIAPVFAIRGNVENDWRIAALAAERTVEIDTIRILVLHNLAELKFDPAEKNYAAVISGHSHKPGYEFRGGVLFLNPGSAGPRRFRLPVSVARIRLEGGRLEPEIIHLL